MSNVFEGKPDARQSSDQTMRPSRFRPTYRALSDHEKALHDRIKTLAVEMESLIAHACATNADRPDVGQGRHGSIALTKLEESVMWAVKGLTA